jgi:hypothetical protein
MKKNALMIEFNQSPDPSQWDSEKLYEVACMWFRYAEYLEEKQSHLVKCPCCFIEFENL